MPITENALPAGASKFSVVVAANDDNVLRGSLMRSPDMQSVKEVLVQRGFASAAQAYNTGLKAATAEAIVFVHQDVFFPEGWFESVSQAIAAISVRDPDWGVLGVFGISLSGEGVGHLYSTGLQCVLGHAFDKPIQVCSLDEVVLIMRRSSGLQFDENLSGFHLYGADICLAAQRKGLNCYAISAFCVHNSNGHALLPRSYLQAASYVRRKWRADLPIRTPCMVITRWGTPLIRHYVRSWIALARKRQPGVRCADPSALYQQLWNERKL